MHLTNIEDTKDFCSNDDLLADNIMTKEILELVENNLNGEYRTIYLKVKSGIKVHKSDMDKLTAKLREIINKDG